MVRQHRQWSTSHRCPCHRGDTRHLLSSFFCCRRSWKEKTSLAVCVTFASLSLSRMNKLEYLLICPKLRFYSLSQPAWHTHTQKERKKVIHAHRAKKIVCKKKKKSDQAKHIHRIRRGGRNQVAQRRTNIQPEATQFGSSMSSSSILSWAI